MTRRGDFCRTRRVLGVLALLDTERVGTNVAVTGVLAPSLSWDPAPDNRDGVDMEIIQGVSNLFVSGLRPR